MDDLSGSILTYLNFVLSFMYIINLISMSKYKAALFIAVHPLNCILQLLFSVDLTDFAEVILNVLKQILV